MSNFNSLNILTIVRAEGCASAMDSGRFRNLISKNLTFLFKSGII
jgi:hypothetical protein